MNKNLLKLFLAIFITGFIFTQAYSQPGLLWSRTFGNLESDWCNSIIQTRDGGYAMAGYSYTNWSLACNFWLVKTNEYGDSLWSRTYGGRAYSYCRKVIELADGGFILAGYTTGYGGGSHDFFLVRTNANGDSLWARTFGGGGSDFCSDFIQTRDGGFALAGNTNTYDIARQDFWLIKTDANGNLQWSNTFGGEGTDQCFSIIQTRDGGYALVGFTYSFDVNERDFWLVKTDSRGNEEWNRTFGGDSLDDCHNVMQTYDGGYMLSGSSVSYPGKDWDYLLIKTDENGEALWSRNYGGIRKDFCQGIMQTIDGGFALSGYTYSFGVLRSDFWLLKVNEVGDSLWSRTFGGSGAEFCQSLIRTPDNGYAMAGQTSSFGAGMGDFWLVKTGRDPTSVSEDNNGIVPGEFGLSEPYPNPFNSQTRINYNVPQPGQMVLKITDIAGREIETLWEGERSTGSYTAVWDAAGISNGVYLVQLMDASGRIVSTEKAVLVK